MLITLAGMKHCGKSTLGKLLAQKLDCIFTDSDDLVLTEIHRRGFESIREFYASEGKSAFVQTEAIVMNAYIKRLDTGLHILSTGGGLADHPKLIRAVKALGPLIYIEAPEELLYQRIMANGRPAMLGAQNPKADFHRLYNARTKVYASEAHKTVLVSDATVEDNFNLLYDVVRGVLDAG